jgi:hypothetical protein
MVGLTPPPHGAWTDNNGRPIYFDSIDNSDYILGNAKHSARRSWVYIDGENFMGARTDVAGDPSNPDVNIAWKSHGDVEQIQRPVGSPGELFRKIFGQNRKAEHGGRA